MSLSPDDSFPRTSKRKHEHEELTDLASREHTLSSMDVLFDPKDAQALHVMKKLDTNVLLLRNRVIQLQDELQQKEDQVQELSMQLKKAENGADEMARLVRTLQFQVNALTTSNKGPKSQSLRPGERGRGKGDGINSARPQHSLDIRKYAFKILTPLVVRARRLRVEANSLKQLVEDKMKVWQINFQNDMMTMLQAFAPFLNQPEHRPSITMQPPRQSVKPLRSRGDSISHRTQPVTEKCDRFHMTPEALGRLQGVVTELCKSVGQLYKAAGIPKEIPFPPQCRDMKQQWDSIQVTISTLRGSVEEALTKLPLRAVPGYPKIDVVPSEEVVTAAELHIMEEEQEEMQGHVSRCVDLIVQARSDETARKQLPSVMAQAEAFITSLPESHPSLGKADKAIQCSLDKPRGRSQGPHVAGAQPPVNRSGSVEEEDVDVQQDSEVQPTAPGSDGPFQRTVDTLQKLLQNCEPESAYYQELLGLLEEATSLAREHSSPSIRKSREIFKPTVPDDAKAVLRFEQWKINHKLRLAKQRRVLGNVFLVLKTWFYNTDRPQQNPVPAAPSSTGAPTASSASPQPPSLTASWHIPHAQPTPMPHIFPTHQPEYSSPPPRTTIRSQIQDHIPKEQAIPSKHEDPLPEPPVLRPKRSPSASPYRRTHAASDPTPNLSHTASAPSGYLTSISQRSPVIPTMTQLLDMPSKNLLRGSLNSAEWPNRSKLHPLPQSPASMKTVSDNPFEQLSAMPDSPSKYTVLRTLGLFSPKPGWPSK